MHNNQTTYLHSDSEPTSGNWELSPALEEEVGIVAPRPSDEASNLAIEAYQKGKEVGRQEGRQEGQRQVMAMLDQLDALYKQSSADLAVRALSILKEKGIQYAEVRLRIVELTVYDILIEVEEDAFVRDDFLQVYEAVWELEREARSDAFYPSVNFMSINFDEKDRINYQALIGDGFIYRLQHASPA